MAVLTESQLSKIHIFSERLWTTATEIIDQQIDLWNSATNGAILLSSAAHKGSFSDRILWAGQQLVRRRDVMNDADIPAVELTDLLETAVKVAAGSFPVQMNPSTMTWIQENPEVQAAIVAQQLAPQMFQDMLNIAIGALVAALSTVPSNVKDVTGNSGVAAQYTFINQSKAARLFGDNASKIAVWLSHSSSFFDLYENSLQNESRLFFFGTVNVVADPLGRPMVFSDSPSLVLENSDPTLNKYYSLGLTQAAAIVGQNNDYMANYDTRNGGENIKRTWQAEWTFNVGLKGFAWNKETGGASPTSAALLSGSNWNKILNSHKHLAGVLLITKPAP